MVEYWSVGFKSNDPFINFPVKRNLLIGRGCNKIINQHLVK